MAITGQLGNQNSQLGNIELGAGAAQGGVTTQSVSGSDSGIGVDSGSVFVNINLLSISDSGVGVDDASVNIGPSGLMNAHGEDTTYGVDTASFVDITPFCD